MNEPLLELTIEKLVTGGRGLARHEGRAIFVPLAAPGDRVRVRLVKQRKGFAEAELLEVLERGPDRREAPCPHFGECGGCDLQHLGDAAQIAARREILVDCFQRLGGLDIADRLEPEPPDAPVLGHRNRIRLTQHPTGHYGLKRRGTRDVVPIATCPVMPPRFTDVILPFLKTLPPVDEIVVRLDGQGGWLAGLYGSASRLRPLKRQLDALPPGEAPAPGLVGLLFNNRPVWGRGYLVVPVAGRKYRVSLQSFFQGNLAAAEAAVATVRDWLPDSLPAVADLYAGVGLFTLAVADRAGRILAVESDPSAVRDLENNVGRDRDAAGKTTVLKLRVEDALLAPDAEERLDWPAATVVVDPPRTGLGKEVLAALIARRPARIVYLSCDPATLARDTAVLAEAGWQPQRVRPLVMFPQTSHLETLVLLEPETATP